MRPSFTVTTTSNFTARDALRSSFFVAKAPQKGYNVIIGSLSKNSCRGEHCSPVPVCLIRKPSRKARCCAKLAGDQWSPLHSLYNKAGAFSYFFSFFQEIFSQYFFLSPALPQTFYKKRPANPLRVLFCSNYCFCNSCSKGLCSSSPTI